VIPTGSYWLDEQLGGGWPAGKVSEIYGDPGAGTTTLALHALAEATHWGPCLYLEWGNSFDYHYAADMGVDLTNLIVATDLSILRIMNDSMPLVVIDQPWVPPGLIPENQTVLLVSQKSSHVKTATVRVRLREDGVWHGGQTVSVQITQNGDNPVPLGYGHLDLHYGKGFSRVEEVLALSLDRGILQRRGTHYFLAEMHVASSWEKVVRRMQDNPDGLIDLEQRLRNLALDTLALKRMMEVDSREPSTLPLSQT